MLKQFIYTHRRISWHLHYYSSRGMGAAKLNLLTDDGLRAIALHPSYSSQIFSVVVLALLSCAAYAGQVSVAVAANFSAPMQEIAAAFEKEFGHKATLVFASTGKFYAQIKNGAPFEVFLSADDKTLEILERENLAVSGTRFTYAIGKLVLWSNQSKFVDAQGAVLKHGNFKHLAIANPKLAPYGEAAFEVLTRLDLLPHLQARLVQGENIAQAYQFIASGNADLGFIALSQVFKEGKITQGSGWIVPNHLYTPIRQDAVILLPGKTNQAASSLMQYLRAEKARAIIRSYGYDIDAPQR